MGPNDEDLDLYLEDDILDIDDLTEEERDDLLIPEEEQDDF